MEDKSEERRLQLIASLSREVKDGDDATIGTGSTAATVAFMVAKRTHAPNATLTHPHGRGMGETAFPITLSLGESLVLRHALAIMRGPDSHSLFRRGNAWLKGHRMLAFLRPAQMDCYGNSNNSLLGSFDHPKIRLAGAAGITDLTNQLPTGVLHVCATPHQTGVCGKG
jgi:glutaconate CoA-transferase subunit B